MPLMVYKPDGFPSASPYILATNAQQLIEFLTTGVGATPASPCGVFAEGVLGPQPVSGAASARAPRRASEEASEEDSSRLVRRALGERRGSWSDMGSEA